MKFEKYHVVPVKQNAAGPGQSSQQQVYRVLHIFQIENISISSTIPFLDLEWFKMEIDIICLNEQLIDTNPIKDV